MARLAYEEIISDIVEPDVIDNVVTKELDDILSLGTLNTVNRDGDKITDTNCVSLTSNGGEFDRNDAYPISFTKTFVQPYWNKRYYHEAAEVNRLDIDQALSGSPLLGVQMLKDAASEATRLLYDNIAEALYTELRTDIDSASPYSDAGTTRITALQSYEEATDTPITLALMRGAQDALGLRHKMNKSEYIWLLEENVRQVAQPLMSATGSWVQNDPKPGDSGAATGYVPVSTFDGIQVETRYGLTTGDALLYRKKDVQIRPHMKLQMEMVPVNRYAYKIVVMAGINLWVRKPRFQAKMTDKD